MYINSSSLNIMLTMIEREAMWLKRYMDYYQGRKYAIFSAGYYARKFYRKLLDDYNIEADFFIDNNCNLSGQLACGKPIMYKPWEDIANFSKEYFIIIATSDINYRQISKQLDEVCVPYISSDAYQSSILLDRCKAIMELLDDNMSKASYLGILWYRLTYDSSLIQTVDNQYFAVKQFMHTIDSVVYDTGAYLGYVTEEYIKRGLGRCKVIAFEPDYKSQVLLNARASRLKYELGSDDDSIQVIPVCVGKENGSVWFLEKSFSSHIDEMEEGLSEVQMYSIDNFSKNNDPPTIIKADIEGAELDMLIGATETIRNFKPMIAICIYHLAEDLVSIPEYIHYLCPEYKMAVRNHSLNHEDTVLYCWV